MAQVDGSSSQNFWQHLGTGEVAPSRIRTPEGEPFSKMRRIQEPHGPNSYIVSKDVFHYLRPISCVDDLKEENMRKGGVEGSKDTWVLESTSY